MKLFLHLSKDEQRQRFLARLAEPGKEWKFSASDASEREHWDAYMDTYKHALTATSTKSAPCYVIRSVPKSTRPTSPPASDSKLSRPTPEQHVHASEHCG